MLNEVHFYPNGSYQKAEVIISLIYYNVPSAWYTAVIHQILMNQ